MKSNEKALVTFITSIDKIKEQLDAIQEHAENFMDTNPEDVNWGHVGSAQKVVTDLSDIMAFWGITEIGRKLK